MQDYKLVQYRPNRWVKVDVETGEVIGLVEPQEVESLRSRIQTSTAGFPTTVQAGTESAAGAQAGKEPPSPPQKTPSPAPEKPVTPGIQQPTPSAKAKPSESQHPAPAPKVPASDRLQGNGRAWPLEKRCPITSSFEAHKKRTPPSSAPGIDLGCPVGTEVRAWAAGKVTRSRWSKGGGRALWINHGKGIQTYYAHLNCVHVLEGESVSLGQKIGESGNTGNTTGPHLHFSVIKRRKYVNPEPYLRFGTSAKT
jgi:murein DD-endopeptidase MepM/ murein hydrolase activator NlpD